MRCNNPNHFESILNLGTLLGQTNKPNLAKPFLQKAIQVNPNNIKTHNNLGMVFQKLGEHQTAINSFEKAISIEDNAEPLLALASCLRMKDIKFALELAKKALAKDPKYVDHNYTTNYVMLKNNMRES